MHGMAYAYVHYVPSYRNVFARVVFAERKYEMRESEIIRI